MSQYRSGSNYSGSFNWLSPSEKALRIEEIESEWVRANDTTMVTGLGLALIGLLCCVAPLSLWFML